MEGATTGLKEEYGRGYNRTNGGIRKGLKRLWKNVVQDSKRNIKGVKTELKEEYERG